MLPAATTTLYGGNPHDHTGEIAPCDARISRWHHSGPLKPLIGVARHQRSTFVVAIHREKFTVRRRKQGHTTYWTSALHTLRAILTTISTVNVCWRDCACALRLAWLDVSFAWLGFGGLVWAGLAVPDFLRSLAIRVAPNRQCGKGRLAAGSLSAEDIGGTQDSSSLKGHVAVLKSSLTHSVQGARAAWPSDTHRSQTFGLRARVALDSRRFSILQHFTKAGLADAVTMHGSQHTCQCDCAL